jgi:hypothetical protein
MPPPALRDSSNAASSGDGGVSAQLRQQCANQRSGVSQVRTARSRRGQQHRMRGRGGLIFPLPVRAAWLPNATALWPLCATSKRRRHSIPAPSGDEWRDRFGP